MSYTEKLRGTNMNQSVQNFVSTRIVGDIDIPLRCALTKSIVKVPIRHRLLISINCVFELEEWVLFKEKKQNEQLNECPGCRAKVNWDQYGVDYQLLNIISLMKFKDPQQINYRQDKIRFQTRKNLYYAFSKHDPKQLIRLPGCKEIVNPNLIQVKVNSPINDQLTQSMVKFQQIILWKKIQYIDKKGRIGLDEANKRLYKVVPKVQEIFRKHNKLIEIGKESINNDQFVFTLRQIYKKDQNYSVLVVYYPCQNIWLDFELIKPNGQLYVQLDGVLYIKDGSQQDSNVIYLAGGNISRYQQSDEFYKIVFPKDPMTDIKELKMQRLPNLVKNGYNYMGTIYKGKIYLFYGQRRIIDELTQQVIDELLNVAYVFKNNTWYNLQIELLPRLNGSYFILDHAQYKRCVFFYGGVSSNLDGLLPFAAKGVGKGQIFVCEKEQLLGAAQTITFPFAPQYQGKLKQDNVINSPIFSIPYYDEYQLLISGEYMKELFVGKRQIFTYNWVANHIFLNEVLSMAPPEQILTPQIKDNGIIFTPVLDQMGTRYHNIFYTIYQYEDQNKEIITELLKINLATGEFLTQSFQNREQCQKEFQNFYKGLVQQKNRIIE